MIFINSLNTILECNTIPLQSEFSGRTRTNTGDVQMQGNTGVIFSDQGIAQQALRSVAQQAVRKYLASCGSRGRIIVRTVDSVMSDKQSTNVECKELAEELIQVLSTTTIFGIELDPLSQRELRDAHRDLENNCPSGLPSDVMPLLKYVAWSRERAGMDAFRRYNAIARDLCRRAADAYSHKNPNRIDCVMDAVQFSVNNPPARGRRGEEHLTPGNVLQIAFDLFEAGSQTSVITLTWALLKCASDQDLQENLYQEIITTIDTLGNFPERKDKQTLPRLQSYLKEVLRFWPAAPFGLPRKLLHDTRIGSHTLPANSSVLFNLHSANRDPSYWKQGEVFDPERFLDSNGNFDDRVHKGFTTFSLGARSCVGNIMAFENLFFVFARILHKWKILPDKKGISLVPKAAALMLDAKYQHIELQAR